MYDTTTPGFRKLQSEGGVAFNPMQKIREVSSLISEGVGVSTRKDALSCTSPALQEEGRTDGPACFYYVYNGGFFNALAPAYPLELISREDLNSLVSEITTKVLAERGMADNNLFESVAEYRQTLGMFRGILGGFWKWLITNEAKLRSLNPAKAWLMWRYGIKPLVSDVEAIAKGLKQKVGKRRKSSRASGTINRSGSTSYVCYTHPAYLVSATTQSTDILEARGMSLDEYFADVYSNIGFTGKGLITTPWELVPYSFVFDWFFNFGDFLKALAPAPGYTQLGSAISVRRISSTIYTISGATSLGPVTLIRQPTGSFMGLREEKTRGPLGLPKVVTKFNFRLDEGIRLADSAALIAVKIGSIMSGRK